MLSNPSATSGRSNRTIDTPTGSMSSFSRRASDCESSFSAMSQELGLPSTGDFDASRDWVTQELESFLVGLNPSSSTTTSQPLQQKERGRKNIRRRTLSEAFCNDSSPAGQSYQTGSIDFDGSYDDNSSYSYSSTTTAATAATTATTGIGHVAGFTKRYRLDLG